MFVKSVLHRRTFETMPPKAKPLPPPGTAFEMAFKGDAAGLGKSAASDLRATEPTTGNTVLHWAADAGREEAVAVLLGLVPPLNLNVKCSISGNTPLLRACRNGHTKVHTKTHTRSLALSRAHFSSRFPSRSLSLSFPRLSQYGVAAISRLLKNHRSLFAKEPYK